MQTAKPEKGPEGTDSGSNDPFMKKEWADAIRDGKPGRQKVASTSEEK